MEVSISTVFERGRGGGVLFIKFDYDYDDEPQGAILILIQAPTL